MRESVVVVAAGVDLNVPPAIRTADKAGLVAIVVIACSVGVERGCSKREAGSEAVYEPPAVEVTADEVTAYEALPAAELTEAGRDCCAPECSAATTELSDRAAAEASTAAATESHATTAATESHTAAATAECHTTTATAEGTPPATAAM